MIFNAGRAFQPFGGSARQVEVFREGTNEGYGFLDQACTLEAVISVAMPNCNEKMADSPVDAHPDAEGRWTSMSTCKRHLSRT